MKRQLEFPTEMMRTVRLLAKVLLWKHGELELEPAEVLTVVRALRAKLIALEAAANEASLARVRSDARAWSQRVAEANYGDETEAPDDIPF